MPVKLKDFSKTVDKALKLAMEEARSTQNMTKLGISLRDDIRKRVKLGFGVEKSNGKKVKLKPLSEKYRIQRKKSKKFKLDGTTSPAKSNLTRTGRMLRSLGVLGSIGSAIIGFNSDKQGQIAAYVSKARSFFFATDLEQKRLTKKAEKLIKQLTIRNFNRLFK